MLLSDCVCAKCVSVNSPLSEDSIACDKAYYYDYVAKMCVKCADKRLGCATCEQRADGTIFCKTCMSGNYYTSTNGGTCTCSGYPVALHRVPNGTCTDTGS